MLKKHIRISDDTYDRLKDEAEGFTSPDETINDILDQLYSTWTDQEEEIDADLEEDDDDVDDKWWQNTKTLVRAVTRHFFNYQ